MPLIDVSHLTKDFGAVRAVEDLTFGIEAGTIAGFLGPNGSGKTTTLRSLLGLVEPTSGTALIDDRPYRELRDPLRRVGVMLEAAAHPARSARDHLRILAAEAGVPRSRAEELLALVELEGAAGRRAGGFSLGMRQRLGLAGAMIGDPQVLVLDEPANGLDPEGIRWLRDFLRGLAAEGRTVLLSSHVLSEVAQTVDEAVVIAGGRLVVHAPLEQLLQHGSGDAQVRVRSSDPTGLAAALAATGAAVSPGAGDELLVTGASQSAVAEAAFDHRIVVYALATEAASLEDVFFHLTSETPEEAVA
jgi:ABC-2 type transport system ATP-binding protein